MQSCQAGHGLSLLAHLRGTWPDTPGAGLCRQAFPLVKQKADDLAASLKKLGPSAAVDMDDAGMRFTLDVVALVPPSGNPA